MDREDSVELYQLHEKKQKLLDELRKIDAIFAEKLGIKNTSSPKRKQKTITRKEFIALCS